MRIRIVNVWYEQYATVELVEDLESSVNSGKPILSSAKMLVPCDLIM